MILVRNLVYRSHSRRVLDGMELEVHPRELVAAVGPAGAGKTALLECLGGLRPFCAGNVWVDDVNIAGVREYAATRLAYVPAAPPFPGGASVLDTLKDACFAVGRRMPDPILRDALLRAGIAPEWHNARLDRSPVAVRRKLGFAVATLRNPAGYLLDEPLQGLEPEDVELFLAGLRRIRKRGAAILVATRDLAFAQRVATRVLIMEAGRLIENLDLTASRRDYQADSYLSHLVA